MTRAVDVSAAAGSGDLPRRRAGLLLAALLIAAFVMRLLYAHDGALPWTFYKDEQNNVERALRFAAEGSLHPHWFNKPAFGYYVLLGEFGVQYAIGRLTGEYAAPEDYAIQWLVHPEPLLLVGRINAAVFGVAGIWLCYLLARRLGSRRFALCAAAALALCAGHLSSSAEVKKDTMAAAFTTAALIAIVDVQRRGATRDHVRAGVFAGLSAATKYYGVFLIVPYLLAQFLRDQETHKVHAGRAPKWPLTIGQVAFWITAFLATPWNFLSSQFFDERLLPQIRFVLSRLSLLQLAQSPEYAHSGVVDPESHSLLDSVAWMGGRLISGAGFGLPLTLLAALGIVVLCVQWMSLSEMAARRWTLIGTALVLGLSMASIANAQFTEARHLNAVYPQLALVSALALIWLAGRMPPRAPGVFQSAPMLLALVALVPAPGFPAYELATRTCERRQLDPRIAAVNWVESNIAAGSVLLNDRDWVPLQPSVQRCEKVLEQVALLHKDAQAHLDAAASEVDPARREQRAGEARRFMTACDGYKRLWELMLRAAKAAERPTYDVISLDQDWYTEDLKQRLKKAGGYSPLPPRSPLGHVFRLAVESVDRAGKPLDAAALMNAFVASYEELLRRDAVRSVSAQRPLPENLEAAIAARTARGLAPLGTDPLHPNLVPLWSQCTPVSQRWLSEGRNDKGQRVFRSVEWFVTSQHNYEAFGNESAAHKRANFPDWAALYDDLAAHYNCHEFGTGSQDNRQIIRIYDLRQRTETPRVERHP
jgi:hypothetical protein